jgi:glycosyltransferase involved in cell wall biosynthesis
VIVVITKQQLDEINGTFLVGKPEQFRVINYGIDLESLESEGAAAGYIRQQIGAATSDTVVGFVGRLTEIKNVTMLLQAADCYLRNKADSLPPTTFMIAGDGHLRAFLESEAQKYGLSREIKFLGNVTDIAPVYKASDIIALTSLNEGTPFSLIESMAARRPVISTMVGGVVDLLGDVKERRDGFFICERGIGVESGDVGGFVSGLTYLIKHKGLRDRLADAGREFVGRKFSITRLVRDIRELYKEMLGSDG